MTKAPCSSMTACTCRRTSAATSGQGRAVSSWSIDACTPLMVDVVLKSHGLSLADLEAWGGRISYDQQMPNRPSRMGRFQDGELDAIFDEGVVMWADQVTAAGGSLLPISPAQLDALEARGY